MTNGPKLIKQPSMMVTWGYWITLGDLRKLVARADELQWPDESLVNHKNEVFDHPTQRGYAKAEKIMIEGPG